ncbi:S49 family peptidase [Psychromarinibacter sp. C21-152]|uniref:S49 family peptidase n=1 Tax=Psychromarinibacter sediminicola TaxID=3033385 RepID=A0AAE3NR80_9RHOB|nr:S49 family peptidase [Psychromarinibacter sediminicola]MDF0602793.1 S49 family peptidase [Psychromarinibacter sediminicola]
MIKWLPFTNRRPTVAILRLNGMIASGSRMNALNDAGLASMIEKAFRRGKPDAVALVVNSPGGSPVQSSLIAARIRRLAQEKNVKVYAFTEDVAASGGYWLACAGDEIWVDPSSVVGSIGVIYAGFGFQNLIAQYGIERRVHTAGRSKSMLDPFRDEKPEDVERLKGWQEHIHEIFIDYVKDRRGARLAEDDEMFTGTVWIGRQSVDKGLADGVGHVVPKMKEIFGDKVRFIPYGRKRSLFARLGAHVADDALAALEERGAYARFGL